MASRIYDAPSGGLLRQAVLLPTVT